MKLEGYVIIFKRSKNLMGSIILNDSESVNIQSAEDGLNELLAHLEHMCPEIEQSEYNNEKLSYLLEQYASNIL